MIRIHRYKHRITFIVLKILSIYGIAQIERKVSGNFENGYMKVLSGNKKEGFIKTYLKP